MNPIAVRPLDKLASRALLQAYSQTPTPEIAHFLIPLPAPCCFTEKLLTDTALQAPGLKLVTEFLAK
jgi:hypothetical protein